MLFSLIVILTCSQYNKKERLSFWLFFELTVAVISPTVPTGLDIRVINREIFALCSQGQNKHKNPVVFKF